MSGTPVTAGRRKSKGHRSLPYSEWPQVDCAVWEDLFRDGDLLDDAGAALHWREATRRTNQAHYGRWLAWLASEGHLELGGGDGLPWERATPDAVEAYARALLAQVAPRTAASSLIGLKCVLQRLAPEADWIWLRRLTNRLDSWATPSRQPRAPEQTLPEMFEQALGELDRLSCIPLPKARDRRTYRDTLLVALLLACPIRLRNLAQMELERHLVRLGTEWHLRFEPGETKTGQALHLVVPDALTLSIEHYLTHIRPAFRGAGGHARVWVAQEGRPMAYETLYDSIRSTSRRLFGTALNPHAFRSLAATLLAEASPEDALHARPLLGHRQPQTTEKHYIRASQMSAARKVAEALRRIRDAQPHCTGAWPAEVE